MDQFLLEVVSDAILLVNKEKGIVACSKNFERLLGYNRHELIGKNPAFWQHETPITAFVFEAVHQRTTEIFVNCQPKNEETVCTYALSLHHDPITASCACVFKQTPFPNYLSIDVLQSIVDHTRVMMGVVELVPEENDILHVCFNQATTEYLFPGRSYSEVVGKKARDLGFRPEDVAHWISFYQKTENSKSPIQTCKPVQTPNGKMTWLYATAAFIGKTAEGRPRICFIIEDVTMIKEAEEEAARHRELYLKEIEEKNKVLLTAERLQDGWMLSMSHELRTPITTILGLTEELLESPVGGQWREVLALILEAAQRLMQLTSDMLDLEKLKDLHERFNPQQIIDAIKFPEAPAPLVRSTSMPDIMSPSKYRVLVAEDNLVNQRVIERQLSKLGFVVDIVHDGRQLMEKLKTMGPGHYALILMDLFMPNMNGFEATTAIREWEAQRVHRTPIVALTANVMTGLREKCLQVGMDEFLSKPCPSQTLHQMLARFLTK